MRGYHDVEHYRPKGRANRLPGCQLTHGYWWLAFSWDNLLYACPGCNRTGKNDSFPLDNNCSSLVAEAAAPGSEIPLLLDPGSGVNPIEHIEFVKLSVGLVKNSWSWWARPRNGSRMGNFTIDICDLNRDELRELRDDHFETILLPQIKALDQALRTANRRALMRELSRALGLLEPRNVNVAFTYDALRASVPNARLLASGHKGWPRPDEVGV